MSGVVCKPGRVNGPRGDVLFRGQMSHLLQPYIGMAVSRSSGYSAVGWAKWYKSSAICMDRFNLHDCVQDRQRVMSYDSIDGAGVDKAQSPLLRFAVDLSYNKLYHKSTSSCQ